MSIEELGGNVMTQNDFSVFVNHLKIDYIENANEWENDSIDRFLDALQAYTCDKKQNEVSWKVFAEILLAAKVYE